MFERTSVGLDVHARTVVACALDGQTGELFRQRLTPDREEILAWIISLPPPAKVVYEAGPTGFGLARFLLSAGIDTVVAAPSKLQRPSGDRVKTDAKDALHLARLLKLGEITAVQIPSVEQEAARDLVRSREDVRGDLMRCRHRISKLLLRQGIVYSGGQAWTGTHELWLARQHFDSPVRQLTYESSLEAMHEISDRRDRLDRAITSMAYASEYTPVVRSLQCLRGISTLTAFGLAVEIGEWDRFTVQRLAPIWAWSLPSIPLGRPGPRAQSRKLEMDMPAGFSSKRPGTTAGHTTFRPGSCGRGGKKPAPRRERVATPGTGACTNVG